MHLGVEQYVVSVLFIHDGRFVHRQNLINIQIMLEEQFQRLLAGPSDISYSDLFAS